MLKHWGALASRQALRSMMLVTVPPSSCTMVSMAGVTDTALPWAATEATHWEMVSSLTKGLTPSCTSTVWSRPTAVSRASSPRRIDSCPVAPPGTTSITLAMS